MFECIRHKGYSVKSNRPKTIGSQPNKTFEHNAGAAPDSDAFPAVTVSDTVVVTKLVVTTLVMAAIVVAPTVVAGMVDAEKDEPEISVAGIVCSERVTACTVVAGMVVV